MPEMKDSSIPSFGAIPKAWELVKLKTILTLRSERNTGGRELLSVYLNKGVISYADSTGMQVHKPSQDLSNYQNVYVGDFVLNNQQAWRGSVGVSKYDGIISPAYFVYRLSSRCDPRYMDYLLRDACMYQQYETASRGVGTIQRNLYAPWLLNCFTILPPLSDQCAIAALLDSKCAEIDALVADIQFQIDTLEQCKCSVITETVTKGLNADVKMRDSGLDFVGDIPAHWEIHPLYYYFGERKNKNVFGQETNLLSLSYGRIIRKDINSNDGLLPESFAAYNIIEAGDIIIRPTDLQNDKRSLRTGLSKEHGIITSAYIALKPIKAINVAYFHYLLHAFDVMKVFYNMGNGVRQGLNFSEFSRLMVFEPTLEEQDSIVDALDNKCDKIDSIIADKKRQLKIINEYKKSLIFEYVTGKTEVPKTVAVVGIDPHALLLAAIVDTLGVPKGKVVNQKLLYLCDVHLGLGLSTQYYRYEHGPVDLHLNSYIHTLVSSGWYEFDTSGGAENLVRGEKHTEFLKLYGAHFEQHKSHIQALIQYFGKMKRRKIERFATLFAVWNDFIIDGTPNPSDKQIICEVTTNWTPNKANISDEIWRDTLSEMKRYGIIPKGLGLHTLPKPKGGKIDA